MLGYKTEKMGYRNMGYRNIGYRSPVTHKRKNSAPGGANRHEEEMGETTINRKLPVTQALL